MGTLRFIGNVLWFIGGGLISFFTWLFLGLALCLTLIGIPFGLQCLKLATLVLAPFGKEVVYGGKTGSFLMNILWLPLGLVLCLEQVALGLIYCITIIGIPAGLQAFKMAKLALMPFGATVRKKSAVKKEKAKKKAATESTSAEPAPAGTTSVEPTPAETTSAESAPAQPAPAETTSAESAPAEPTSAQPDAAQSEPSASTPIQSTTTQAASVEPTSVQVPAETTSPSIPATPTPTPPSAEPNSPEDAKEEEDQDNKPKFNPVIIIVIVVAVILVLGVGAFFVMPFLLNGSVSPRESGAFESINTTSNVAEPKYSDTVLERATNYCTTSGGTMLVLGYDVSAVLDNIKADQYLCQLNPDSTASFKLSVAKQDYTTILQEYYQEFTDQCDDDYALHYYTSFAGYIESLAVSYNAVNPATVTPIEDYPYYFRGYITSELQGNVYVVLYSDMLLQIIGLDQASAESIISAIGLNSTDISIE